MDEEEKVIETPPEEAPPPEPEKKPEPPEGSKRWNEIYYEAKEAKRKLAEFEAKLAEEQSIREAMVDHNKSLQEAMDGLYDKVSASDRPDPMADPEGYDRWLLDRAKRELTKKEKAAAPVKPPAPEKLDKVKQQLGIMKSIYDDYDQVAEFAKGFLDKDPIAKNDLVFSENPPRALYEYGLKKKAELSSQRSRNIDAAAVEGGTPPVSSKGVVQLTPEQERARLGLGISKEAYMKQLEIIQKKRGY